MNKDVARWLKYQTNANEKNEIKCKKSPKTRIRDMREILNPWLNLVKMANIRLSGESCIQICEKRSLCY
jgi:hypothetical protein